jgi:hypothetical protein
MIKKNYKKRMKDLEEALKEARVLIEKQAGVIYFLKECSAIFIQFEGKVTHSSGASDFLKRTESL